LQEIRGLAVGALGKIPALRQRMVDQLTEVDLNYRGIGLTAIPPHGASHRPAAGERASDVPLLRGEASRLYEVLRRGRFVVLSVGASPVPLPESLTAIAAAAEAQANDGDDYERGHIYLIRPDAYVMLSCSDGDAAPILGALTALLPA
jgi:hypothetical protein